MLGFAAAATAAAACNHTQILRHYAMTLIDFYSFGYLGFSLLVCAVYLSDPLGISFAVLLSTLNSILPPNKY